ncbi:MAG: Gfo/Idh/MocA family oxidoreductase, partial [Gammaproteobacteria bacterium]
MVGVGVLSRWHVHATEYARTVNEQDDARVVAAWDEDAARGSAWAAELEVPFEAGLDDLLAREDVDAVVVTAPTNMHRDVMIAAARAGKHIFTEKVLALSVAECREIAEAVSEAGVKFCISFPRRTIPPLRYAKELVDSGRLGKVTLVRIRVAHDGATRDWLPAHFYDPEACGGGAMIDLGAHGMYLSRWLLGEPTRVSSIFNHVTGRQVEDNCVTVIEFDNRAIAVNETGFVSWGGAYSVEIDGTEGGFWMLGPREVRVRGKAFGDDRAWQSVDALPDPGVMPIAQWIA